MVVTMIGVIMCSHESVEFYGNYSQLQQGLMQ